MSKTQDKTFNSLWNSVKDLNGNIEAMAFKDYVFTILFYSFLSTNLIDYVKEKYNKNYLNMTDDNSYRIREEIIKDKDFFIRPSDLFQNVVLNRVEDEYLDTILSDKLQTIEASSTSKLLGTFKTLNFESRVLGEEHGDRSSKLGEIVKSINKIKINNIDGSDSDLFGNAYEFILNKYGQSGAFNDGVYYTPPTLANLLVKISELYIDNPINVYDPTCGSGSLLIAYTKKNKDVSYYGQELSTTSYGFCKMNMILHNIKNYKITNADTLTTYEPEEKEKFELILSNPPFSTKWDKTKLEKNDERFSKVPVLPPPGHADYCFIFHILYTLSKNGIALVLDSPGILTRKAETDIREYLVNENVIDTIIQLPRELFANTATGVCLLILRKNKDNSDIRFIDASNEYTKIKATDRETILSDNNIASIINCLTNNADTSISHIATQEEIKNKDYNLGISKYIKRVITIEQNTVKRKMAEDNGYKRIPLTKDVLKAYSSLSNEINGSLVKLIKVDDKIELPNEVSNINTLDNETDEYEEERKRLLEAISTYPHRSFNMGYLLCDHIRKNIDSDKPFIPLEELCDIRTGINAGKTKIRLSDEYEYPLVTVKDIKSGIINPNKNNKKMDKMGKDKVTEILKLKEGYVVFGLPEPTGIKTAVLTKKDIEYGFNETIYIIKTNDETTDPYFLRYILESKFFEAQVNEHRAPGKGRRINIEDFRKLEIPNVPYPIQKEIGQEFRENENLYRSIKNFLENELEFIENSYQLLYLGRSVHIKDDE